MDGGGGSSDSQIALDQASVTIENPIEANTDYTIPLNYTVGSEDLEVFYCGNKLQKDVDYTEVGNVGTISNKIQFKTAIGDLDMSGISGFENFKETLQFATTGKTSYYTAQQLDVLSLLQSNWKLNEHSQIYKINNVVTISLCVKEGEDTLVLVLPEDFRPKNLMFFPATAVEDTAGNHYCNVTVDGKLFIPSANVGKLIMMNFSYLLK